VAFTEFFGEDEAIREATRSLVSPVTVSAPATRWSDPIAKAMAGAHQIAPDAPVDKIETQFKGDHPTIAVFLGKPTGGEDRKLTFDANTGTLVKNEAYADKPFLYRLHSGEAFGDGGLVVAMFWALALALLAVSGFIIYFTMRGKRQLTGIHKVFW
jgi:uncharacterized iron-regulated membrane protein